MTVLAALAGYYDRLADRGGAPRLGYSRESISFGLVLGADGTVADVRDLRVPIDKKMVARKLDVPASFKRPGVTPRAFLLWDNTKFVLGVGRAKATAKGAGMAARGPVRTDAQAAAFRDCHLALLADATDEGLCALRAFVGRWTPDAFPSLGFCDEMLDHNLVFLLDGDCADDGAPRFLHERPAARRLVEAAAAPDDSAAAPVQMCLVTGRRAPVERLHPAIKGVLGAQTAGASLVSFNLDAFASYGKDQGANAPVSPPAAFAYGAALNALLARDSANRLQIADATTVFWAEAARGGEAAARGGETLISLLLQPPTPDDDEEAAKLRDRLALVRDGRPVRDLDPALDPDTRFFVLGLAPNSARLSVRVWVETSLGPLVRRIGQHWRDLRIRPDPWRTAPSVRALLFETAIQRKAETIPPLLGGELMRAILTGGRYPRSLLAAVILRIRADGAVSGPRAALCKAWLVRDARWSRSGRPGETTDTDTDTGTDTGTDPDPEEELVSLNRDDPNLAYRLGRLFAVLESIQRAALGRLNATIRDRYFGAASATPGSVFPLLLRNANHHLAVLRKSGDRGGLAHWFEAEIGQILDAFERDFPRHLRIEDQGRFAVGYYHQRSHRKTETDPDSLSQTVAEA